LHEYAVKVEVIYSAAEAVESAIDVVESAVEGVDSAVEVVFLRFVLCGCCDSYKTVTVA
jgi:hypothetical protein